MTSLAALLLLAHPAAQAEWKLGSPFTDSAVLQQRTQCAIWGWSTPGDQIAIESSWGATAKAKANAEGFWKTTIRTVGFGGPHRLTIEGDRTTTLNDVMLGEVWLCSGQSNMEMEVKKPYPPDLPNQAEVIRTATYPNIRLLLVPNRMSPKPEPTADVRWTRCSPETVQTFSACGYFFGRELYNALNVPIGLIDATWGGTEVELWTSDKGLRRDPELKASLEASASSRETYNANLAKWKTDVLATDPGWGQWSKPEIPTDGWTPIETQKSFEQTGLSAYDGAVWYRATAQIPAGTNLAGARLELGSIDDEDVTFFNGDKVGETGQWNLPRNYPVPVSSLRIGANSIAIRAFDTGGLGGFTTNFVPGLVVDGKRIPLTGWSYRPSKELKDLPRPPSPPKNASLLFNGMINPIAPYGIRGAIWYQGESNVGRAWQYRRSFPNMIRDWREAFGRSRLSFYFVQIAPFNYNSGTASAELRDAQLYTYKNTIATGMVVTTDVTENVADIHPIQKEPVGKRLAAWALTQNYRLHDVFSGPLYKSHRLDGNLVRIRFDHADGGLKINGAPKGFQVCGADRIFVDAQARIEGSELIVWSDRVLVPVAARFGYGDSIIGNLFSGAGLPASPFRTDDFLPQTFNVKW